MTGRVSGDDLPERLYLLGTRFAGKADLDELPVQPHGLAQQLQPTVTFLLGRQVQLAFAALSDGGGRGRQWNQHRLTRFLLV